jgi:rare lipoprotein A
LISITVPRLGMIVLLLCSAGCSARGPRAEAAPSAPAVVPRVPATATVEPVPTRVSIPTTAAVTNATLPRAAAMTPLAVAEGEATYYASYFHGRKTASGIVFSNDEYYAAHRAYPFGTLLRVTNLGNQRAILVRVVDRGPNGTSARARATIIDVSQRAAADLDFIRAGRIRVRVEVLEWGS